MFVKVVFEVTRVEGQNASRDAVMETLQDELESITELTVENDAGNESEWEVAVISVEYQQK